MLAAAPAAAHHLAFHKRVDLVARADGMTALVTLDVPRGPRSLALRAGADKNADRALDADERRALKAIAVRLALESLSVRRGGSVVTPRVGETKIDVHGSTDVGEAPISVAALLTYAGGDGIVEVRDAAPDGNPVPVRISREPSARPAVEGFATRTVPVVSPGAG